MFNQLLNRSPHFIHRTEDPLDLLTTPGNQHCTLFFPCDGYQNVFPYIEKNQELYSDDENVLVVRDLEKVPCFSELRNELSRCCSALPPLPRLKLLFSRPEFEQVYFADLDLLEEVFGQIHQVRLGQRVRNLAELHDRILALDQTRPQRSIKRLFRDYNLAYNKPHFSESFFARFDFQQSNHPYIRRIIDALGELMQMPV